MRFFLLGTLVIFSALIPNAYADQQERRLSIGPRAAFLSSDGYESTGNGPMLGAGLSFGWGLRDWSEVGLRLAYAFGPNIDIDGPQVRGVSGDGLTLYADAHLVEASAYGRLYLDKGPFLAVRPFVGLAGGLGYRALVAAEVFDETKRSIASANRETGVFPVVLLEGGVSWRATDGFALALVLEAAASTSHQLAGVRVELSWFSYEWWAR